MGRHKDANWNLQDPIVTNDHVTFALLMDLRDEMKKNNSLLGDISASLSWGGWIQRELRGLRRDVKAKLKARCHRAHK